MSTHTGFLTQFAHMKREYRPGSTNVAEPLSRVPTAVVAALTLAVSTRYGGHSLMLHSSPDTLVGDKAGTSNQRWRNNCAATKVWSSQAPQCNKVHQATVTPLPSFISPTLQWSMSRQ